MTERTRVLGGIAAVALIGIGIFVASRWEKLSLPYLVQATVVHERVLYGVDISRDKLTVSPGDAVRHRFIVRKDGRRIDLPSLKIYPHVAVVSQDLSDIAFYHVDQLTIPGTGIFDFNHQFTASSPYQLWFEINDNTTPQHHGTFSSYISRIDLPVGAATTPVAQRLITTDRQYRLQLEPVQLAIGKPSVLRVNVEDSTGKSVKLVKDIDHFYFAASPAENFYVLDQPDLSLTAGSMITMNNLVFPKPGRYAIWARMFLDDGTGQVGDVIEGSFVVAVPA